MIRTRATELVLVNWRGVFFERYQLHRHVTALEGVNGAGKTTVMIGCYVVLLPDMTKLRFTNVGEAGAGGGEKGLWGRLGDPGRPSFAALELRLPTGRDERVGRRLIAGVQLERKSEPTIEPTPFIIVDLDEKVRLKSLFLGDDAIESVPELSELADRCARFGGHVERLTTKDYFARLFDLGVTPLRMATDEDRGKLNEMLKTSMTGGISRGLSRDLREFLLKEESGLADTLKQMRATLDSCRRTRIEVADARQLEKEITDIYEAGEAMFAAAVHATQARAEETRVIHQKAAVALVNAEREEAAIQSELSEKRTALQDLTRETEAARAATTAARAWLDRLTRARSILGRMREIEGELVPSRAARDASKQELDSADAEQVSTRSVCDRAEEEVKRAADGVAELRKGLEDLARRAAEHRLVTEKLAVVRAGLPGRIPHDGDWDSLLKGVRSEYARFDAELSALLRRISTADARRQEYGRVMAALTTLAGEQVDSGEAMERARRELRRCRDDEALAAKAGTLPQMIEVAAQRAARQRRVQKEADDLSVPGQAIVTADALRRETSQSEESLSDLTESQAEHERLARDAQHQTHVLSRELDSLQRAQDSWRSAAADAKTLELKTARTIRTGVELAELRSVLMSERDKAVSRETNAHQGVETVGTELQALEHTGGSFDPALLKARDAVDGELLAGRYEDVGVDEAAEVEAMLGPLSGALVVADPLAAAKTLAETNFRPATVWLVGGDADLPMDAGSRPEGSRVGPADVLVPGSVGWRLTRLPQRPTLGKRARERRIDELKKEREHIQLSFLEARAATREIEDSLAQVDRLLPKAGVLERGDLTADVEACLAALDSAKRKAEEQNSKSKDAGTRADSIRLRVKRLHTLLSEADLLDCEDLGAVEADLRMQRKTSLAAAERLSRLATARQTVESQIDVLREAPPSEEQMNALRAEAKQRESDLAALWNVKSSLEHVVQRREALAWSDAEAALRSKKSLEGPLQKRYEAAKQYAEQCKERVAEAVKRRDTALQQFETHKAECGALEQSLGREREELLPLGVEDGSDEALGAAKGRLRDAESTAAAFDEQRNEASKDVGRREEKLKSSVAHTTTCRQAASKAESDWKPELARWERLESDANQAGVLNAVMAPRYTDDVAGAGSLGLRIKAKESAARLVERLKHSQDSNEVVGRLSEFQGKTELSGETCLGIWIVVRDWLKRRMPSDIADMVDPLESLRRLRDRLESLEERLRDDEGNLRGKAADIASSINVQIRRAHTKVRHLNHDLSRVRFGSIHGLRLSLARVDEMSRVLDALQAEQGADLFDPSIPIEQAMEELFQRFAGKSKGQRLLDYREYVQPKIEVKRQAVSQWEEANPTRMSTGEAIGVGAALMMVVLTAWESDANLLRPKRTQGTLRLLFLDEANRLSHDNLIILFDLCRNLDLQLIIAAPEVANAANNITYRLTRHLNDQGREEVRVSGRRNVVEGAE